MPSRLVLGADIGGSHISCGLFDLDTGDPLTGGHVQAPVDSTSDSAEEILETWARVLTESAIAGGSGKVVGLGFAMPGPFDYPGGISLIRNLGKYDALYALNIREEMRRRLGYSTKTPILFANDAECFLLGESWRGAIAGLDSAIGLTIGTGFGSAFLREGSIVTSGQGVPEHGWLYNAPFRGGIAEDYFSGRGLSGLYAKAEPSGDAATARQIAARAAAGEERALAALQDFGVLLGEFLNPICQHFRPRAIVIGGNVARAWEFFSPGLRSTLSPQTDDFQLRPAALFEQAALLGAARLPQLHLTNINDKET